MANAGRVEIPLNVIGESPPFASGYLPPSHLPRWPDRRSLASLARRWDYICPSHSVLHLPANFTLAKLDAMEALYAALSDPAVQGGNPTTGASTTIRLACYPCKRLVSFFPAIPALSLN